METKKKSCSFLAEVIHSASSKRKIVWSYHCFTSIFITSFQMETSTTTFSWFLHSFFFHFPWGLEPTNQKKQPPKTKERGNYEDKETGLGWEGSGRANYCYCFAVSFLNQNFLSEKQPPPKPAQKRIQIILKHTFCKSFNFKQLIYWKMEAAGISLSSDTIGLK